MPARLSLETLRRFWSQPSRAYRDFQLVYGLLAMHFIVPALGYLFQPASAIASFGALGGFLGEGAYPVSEHSYVWRVLAATNVMTLGFLCLFIQADVRRHWPAIYPLVFMKGTTALTYLGVYLFSLRYLPFAGIFVWDSLNCVFFLYFGRRARAAALGESRLVPRPLGA